MQRVTVSKTSHPRYTYCVTVRVKGERARQKYFATKGTADAYAKARRIELSRDGAEAAVQMTIEDRSLIIEAKRRLEPFGKTLRDALDHFEKHLMHTVVPATVDDTIAASLKSKRAEGMTAHHLTDVASRLRRFSSMFGNRQIASISVEDIDDFLASLKVAQQTKLNYRRAISSLFNEAKRHKWISDNPVTEAVRPKVKPTQIGILTPAEARALLNASVAELVPAVAMGLFAGIRREELFKLEWQQVDLESGLIEIRADQAKTAKRRHIKIQACLESWLKPLHQPSGSIVRSPQIWRRQLREARVKAKIHEWPHNAMRHSFASYHLAAFGNAADLALQLGHHDAALLFRHYRELVRPAIAKDYWQISR